MIFSFHGPIRLASLKNASWTEHLLIGDYAWPHRQSADFGGRQTLQKHLIKSLKATSYSYFVLDGSSGLKGFPTASR